MSMQVSTLLHMILLITSARWLLITIAKRLTYWTIANIQVICLFVLFLFFEYVSIFLLFYYDSSKLKVNIN